MRLARLVSRPLESRLPFGAACEELALASIGGDWVARDSTVEVGRRLGAVFDLLTANIMSGVVGVELTGVEPTIWIEASAPGVRTPGGRSGDGAVTIPSLLEVVIPSLLLMRSLDRSEAGDAVGVELSTGVGEGETWGDLSARDAVPPMAAVC